MASIPPPRPRQLDSPVLPRIFKYAGQVRANPDSYIQIGRARLPVHAITADAEQRAHLWPRLTEAYADFDTYQAWTEREIPVIILHPRRSDVVRAA